LAGLNLLLAMGENLQQGEGFLRLLVGADIHQNSARLSVLGDHDRLPVLLQLVENLGRVRLDEADRLDLRRKADGTPPGLNIVR
jgi:hypothetical protein